MDAKNIEIKFTLEQVNAVLNRLGQMPYGQVADLIDGIKAIAAPQVPQQQAQEESAE